MTTYTSDAETLGREFLSDIRLLYGPTAEVDVMQALQAFYAFAAADITRDEAILLFVAPNEWRREYCDVRRAAEAVRHA